MSGGDWLGSRRAEVAAERILDAAGELFAGHGVAGIGMNEIARAAGCSRATLYRYFENREALHRAYVHREARAVHRTLAASLIGISDPQARLLAGLTGALELVRENPALASWFADTPLGAEMAEQSQVIQTLTAGFLQSLNDSDDLARRARWLIRVLTSLLISPGRDADDERAMLEDFVVPMMAPANAAPRLV
jgi:AcrR family transcriptional regulator